MLLSSVNKNRVSSKSITAFSRGDLQRCTYIVRCFMNANNVLTDVSPIMIISESDNPALVHKKILDLQRGGYHKVCILKGPKVVVDGHNYDLSATVYMDKHYIAICHSSAEVAVKAFGFSLRSIVSN